MQQKAGPSAAGAPRKLTIKPLRTAPKLPANFEQATWAKLLDAVRAVHGKRAVNHSLEELYRGVEDMCVQHMAARTYDKLQAECEAHVEASIEALQTPDTSAFLSLVHGCWSAHCEEMLTLRSIFLYLDRTYVMQSAARRSLWEMGLHSFRAQLSARPELLAKLRDGVLASIERERGGDQVERSLLAELLRMLYDLGLYQRHFEEQFLAASSAYYLAEGAAEMNARDVPSYLEHVASRLSREEARVAHYLHGSSRKPLMAAVRQTLLAVHVRPLLERGFADLVQHARLDDLRRMYSLFAQARVNALPELRQAFAAHIKSVGGAMELISFKEKLDTESFEQFINIRQNRPAELVARFLDSKLRAGNKGSSEGELEEDLSKRLLFDKSASIDTEKAMISKLKAECGSAFTSKLEGMFKDIDLSQDVMASFRTSPQAAKVSPSLELSVHVLTQGYWPTYPPVELKLPGEILELQEIFSTYYMSKHNGRRLQWHPCLGHCTLKANFPLGKKEISVSLLQTIVLLLFNDGDGLSYAHVLQATGIEDRELKVTLQSLACGKVRVLRKEPKGREVDGSDRFFLDASFKHPLFRIKINSIQTRESEAENEQTSERVFQDRQYQIDAAIVRVMKARKTLSHSLLMSELFQQGPPPPPPRPPPPRLTSRRLPRGQLKFPLKPPDLKKRIESLIDREYLERDPKSASTYIYLA
ncbi:hypothetical protein EMIHUDRAFT_468368 [Emiliania huxleyi CCMP1516]|uniref:Cullin family profile domain-containing protein n=2 Tax=Emiliania huxleyi TaxID=2903 RepID=A0A0D3K3X3_EMIH1|nr:hypothetical protein EMIHUDRAFT_468368 [Emiliania huxleyi CCMP1516]EOD30458.1 hypothetical protein EMIHUDRAFT_468368 [Emiliania huxleyi CCMP1516]|eukprot:XP_005782887.1 hypothetical protein EMIHUDRAFT_468368 [Emiliania huxleyi CCMP1516]